jgi:hypothetical protein
VADRQTTFTKTNTQLTSEIHSPERVQPSVDNVDEGEMAEVAEGRQRSEADVERR